MRKLIPLGEIDMQCTVSIVTITFNAEKVINETICSVLAQDLTDFEYVFVDGKSTDKTLQIIESYRPKFEEKGIKFRVLSEPDRGIYDAMNKGIHLASGEWLLMLNAGDVLANENVLSRMFLDQDYEADVIYGDTIMTENGYYKKKVTYSPDMIKRQMPFCHQSVFVRTDVLREYGFDTSYRLAADYDLFVRMYQDGVRFEYVKKLVSIYDMTGISEKNAIRTNEEAALIRQRNGITLPKSLRSNTAVRNVINWFYAMKKKMFPDQYFSEANGWYKDITMLF